MKIIRGNYAGASEFAYFNKPLSSMTAPEMRLILELLLQQAAPGGSNSEIVLAALQRAESEAQP